MPKISRNKLEPDVNELILKRLVRTFTKLNKEEELDRLLKNLFTGTERIMLAKRINIAMLLEEGLSYEKISKKLKVSHATISFVRQSLLIRDAHYKELIEDLNRLLGKKNNS